MRCHHGLFPSLVHRPAVLRLSKLFLGLALLLTAPAAWGQDGPLGDRFDLEVRLFGASFDNFFQAPPGAPEDDVTSTRLEARLFGRLQKASPWKLYGQAAFVSYEGALDDATEVGIGLVHDRRPHRFDLFVQRLQDRPSFDVGDEFDRADVDRLVFEYAYRASDDWELTGRGTFEDQSFEFTRSKDNELPTYGGAVRYRGWGYRFSPEIGFEVGQRNAVDPNEDHDQTELWLKLRSSLTRRIYLSARYRLRDRSYDVGDPLASNFQREDDRRQWVLAANVKTVRHLSVDVYYAYEDAESTKASRNFTTSMLGLGLKLEY